MAIAEEDVAQVRAATDIVALISEHAALKRQGRRWVGLCPFHQEKTPSFSVNAEEGFFYCFGCQKSGDAITFVREIEHLDFVDAVRSLADRAGITISEDAAAGAERRRRAPLAEAMTRAVEWYHERLLAAPDAGPARDYLRSRGYDGDTVRTFQLGWAPDDWDALARHLKVPSQVLTDAGLGFVNARGRQQDAFRARILFPIFDPAGHPIALGGRILPGHGGAQAAPKYKNSPDGPLYSKRRTLYGLNWAKRDVVATNEVVVCEGYTDVIGCFLAGVPRAVATCGTALGEEHFRLLGNFAARIVLAYDADAAGQSGASRVYAWERSHNVDVAVATLPPGSDPAELARTDPEALRAAVSGARPFLAFRLERVLSAADRTAPEGRAKAAELAVAVVAEHPNELVRDQYLMEVADRCRLDPDRVRALSRRVAARLARHPGGERRGGPAPSNGSAREHGVDPAGQAGPGGGRAFPGAHGPGPRTGEAPPWRSAGAGAVADRRNGGGASGSPEPGPGAGGAPAASSRAALEALRLAVHQPEQVAGRLDPVLFADPCHRVGYGALAEADTLIEAVELADRRDPAAGELLRRLVVEEPAADADDVIVQLVRLTTWRLLAEVEAEARLSPDTFARSAGEITSVRRDLEELDDRDRGAAAADRLLAWLRTRGEESR